MRGRGGRAVVVAVAIVGVLEADNERNINGYIDVIELHSSRSMVGGVFVPPGVGGAEWVEFTWGPTLSPVLPRPTP